MDERKKILIPGGKHSDMMLVDAAHRMGLYVITSGTDTKAPAHRFADKYVCLDYSDKEAMLGLAKSENVDYMCTCANDFGMISTAYVCEKLGLPGHDPFETTLTVHNKDRFKAVAKKIGMHTPYSEIFTDREAALAYARAQKERVIVKPCDNVASHGVTAPKNDGELVFAIDEAFRNSRKGMILVEPFIEGFFVTCTSMIVNEEVVAFFSDSAHFYPEGEIIGPEFPMNLRNTGCIRPALYHEEFEQDVIADFTKLAKELHLVDGKFHAELLIDKDHKAHIFDLHRRQSGYDPFLDWNGDLQAVPEWDETICTNWADWIVRAECGLDMSVFPKDTRQRRFVHTRRIYAPRNGHLRRVVLDDYATAHLWPRCNEKNCVLMENIDVTDCRHQMLPDETYMIRFMFTDEAEMRRFADFNEDHFYEHFRFEYDD